MATDNLKFSFKTGDRGVAQLFKLMSGGGGKVRVGVIGAKAGATKKVGTDTSIKELQGSLKGIKDKEHRRITKEAIKEHQAARKAEMESVTVAMVAAQHEFGLGVPQRSFIRAWVDGNIKGIQADIRKAIDKVAIGRLTTEQALKVLGVKWVADVQEFITNSSNFKPLSQVTIDRKGSSAPLIDTGQLKSSITSEIVK